MSDPKLQTVCYRDSDGDELVVSPFSGGAAGVELMATHDSGCCVFDDPKVIRNLANQLQSAPLMARSAVMWFMVTTPGSFSTNQPSTPNAVTVRSWQPLR